MPAKNNRSAKKGSGGGTRVARPRGVGGSEIHRVSPASDLQAQLMAACAREDMAGGSGSIPFEDGQFDAQEVSKKIVELMYRHGVTGASLLARLAAVTDEVIGATEEQMSGWVASAIDNPYDAVMSLLDHMDIGAIARDMNEEEGGACKVSPALVNSMLVDVLASVRPEKIDAVVEKIPEYVEMAKGMLTKDVSAYERMLPKDLLDLLKKKVVEILPEGAVDGDGAFGILRNHLVKNLETYVGLSDGIRRLLLCYKRVVEERRGK